MTFFRHSDFPTYPLLLYLRPFSFSKKPPFSYFHHQITVSCHSLLPSSHGGFCLSFYSLIKDSLSQLSFIPLTRYQELRPLRKFQLLSATILTDTEPHQLQKSTSSVTLRKGNALKTPAILCCRDHCHCILCYVGIIAKLCPWAAHKISETQRTEKRIVLKC